MALFSKSKDKASGSGETFQRSDRNANKFFHHAETTAEARNYDYSVEMYIGGLRHQPDNLRRHEQLRDVALRRKVAGGKPAGMMGVKAVGPSPVDKMLTAEKKWAMDPTNRAAMLETMKAAVEADHAEGEEANLAEVALWVGSLCLDANIGGGDGQKPDFKTFLVLRDQFRAVQAFDKAVEACRHAIRMKPTDTNLAADLKDLEAEKYAHDNQSGEEEEGKEGFRKNIRNAEAQELQQAELSSNRAGGAAEKLIAARRAEHEEDPGDVDKLIKLVDALLKKEENEPEREAITLLHKAYEQTGQYKYKLRAGDTTIKQMNRYLRALRGKLKASPDDAELKKKYDDAARSKVQFELKEFGERVEKYPTDLGVKFELGRRQYAVGQVDDAIGNFQQATNDPKRRALAHHLLGKAFLQKGWYDEAIDTLEKGVGHHPKTDDPLAKELRYDLMVAYQDQAEKTSDAEAATKARTLASELLQTDINFRDIRDRVNALKALVERLAAG